MIIHSIIYFVYTKIKGDKERVEVYKFKIQLTIIVKWVMDEYNKYIINYY